MGKPFVCKPRSWLKHYTPMRSVPSKQVDLAEFECRFPEEYKQKGTGSYKVDLSIRQPLAEKTTSIGSLEFKVQNIKHGSRNRPKTVQTTSHDTLVGGAFVYEMVGG